MNFTVRRTRKAVLPDLVWDKKVLTEIGEVAAAGVVDNVLKQKQEDGSRIKVNKPSTRRRKLLEGKQLLSLIDEDHRFIKGGRGSFQHRHRGVGPLRTVVISPATAELREISKHVQRMGYTGWFGISKETADALRLIVRKFIKEKILKAKAKRA